ncbi:endopeptidase La [Mycoplasmopsis columbina SF7]|uniref:endopeptidase La n=1 Tax=Mycoplasmopsis columbina SF7 TaxID=1037410 RepID=F9UK38_9BACT|nr:endopeptidase La [Mycoplasmopsis columbina SF7]
MNEEVLKENKQTLTSPFFLDLSDPLSVGWVLNGEDTQLFTFPVIKEGIRQNWNFYLKYQDKNIEKEHVFIVYTNLDRKNDLSENEYLNKNSDVLVYGTFAQILKVDHDSEHQTLTFTVKGLSKVKYSAMFDENNQETADLRQVAWLKYELIDGNTTENLVQEEDLEYLSHNIQLLDYVITSLSVKDLYSNILDELLTTRNIGISKSQWLKKIKAAVLKFQQTVNKAIGGEYDENSEDAPDEADIINAFMLNAVLGNYDRYIVFSQKDIVAQTEYLLDSISQWPKILHLNKEDLEYMNNMEFYKNMAEQEISDNEDDDDDELIESFVREESEKRIKENKSKKGEDKTMSKQQENNNNEQDKNKIDALLELEIHEKMKKNLDKQQKDFMLREKLKAIKETLNDNNPEASDDDEFQKILDDPKTAQLYPQSVLKLIASENERLKAMMPGSPDANITQVYINTLKKMPWRKVEIETLDIQKAREILDKNHYGLKEVKERIVEYLALIINRKNLAKLNKDTETLIQIDDETQVDLDLFKESKQTKKIQKDFNNVPILTLVGPPGTGKTSLARAIAEALNKSYIKISLGGVHDEAEIRGHRKTYVGAMPGKIIKALQKVGVSNPLILLDEIDKMSSDIKGDPSSAMLEVLDPEQNSKFQDNYLEHEYDLSKVMFIATANYYENIPKPLLDRVEIIELSSYTITEKVKIAKEHLVAATIKQAGLTKEQFQIKDDVIEYIIKHYTAEAGVRGLKRLFDKLARKIVTKIVSGETIKTFKITKEVTREFLGVPKFTEDENEKKPQIGVVNGLAYTSIGGTSLQIEVTTFKGKNSGIKLTGSLKDVMKESANIALTYVRSHAEEFGIKDFNFDEHEIHIHVPEGAVPKDGPSAGVTFTTALISALSNKPVSQDIAMTGEITLRGRVLEIGGLKEKSFAAFKKGIKKIFIPLANKKNLVDIPEEVKNALEFVPVADYKEIYKELFK